MGPSSIRDVALGIISRSPQLQGNPNAQSMIQAIRSGDSKRGEEIARNLCDTYGVKPEEAVQQARRFFHI